MIQSDVMKLQYSFVYLPDPGPNPDSLESQTPNIGQVLNKNADPTLYKQIRHLDNSLDIHSFIHLFIYLTSVRKIIYRKLQLYFLINNDIQNLKTKLWNKGKLIQPRPQQIYSL